jgi:hypothetical protein
MRFVEDACKLISLIFYGVALTKAVALSVESTFQRAKDGDI